MLRLYDSRLSGNSWKVRILLTQLGIPFERVTLDLAKGEAKDPAFCARSRFARVPMLELEDGRPWSSRRRSCSIWPRARRCCRTTAIFAPRS